MNTNQKEGQASNKDGIEKAQCVAKEEIIEEPKIKEALQQIATVEKARSIVVDGTILATQGICKGLKGRLQIRELNTDSLHKCVKATEIKGLAKGYEKGDSTELHIPLWHKGKLVEMLLESSPRIFFSPNKSSLMSRYLTFEGKCIAIRIELRKREGRSQNTEE